MPVIALRGGGPRAAVEVSVAARVGAPASGRARRPRDGVTLDTATVSAVRPADAPDVSVAAAALVAPSVHNLLATIRSARNVPLGSPPAPGSAALESTGGSAAGQSAAGQSAAGQSGAGQSGAARSSAAPAAAPSPHVVRGSGQLRPVVTTPPTLPPRTETGTASWYQAAPGTCAHPTLPFGTVVHILDVTNGHTATCTVDDRGPYQGGRIIDLSYDVFSKLAPVGLGVIDVRLSW